MRVFAPILCGSILSLVTSCSTHESPSASELHANTRATLVLRIEQQIVDMVRASGEWEMAQFRSYSQTDIDGDGIDDPILLTTFELDLHWRRELFVCLSSSPQQVMHADLGGKGERMAEGFDIKGRTIVVRGKTYADGDGTWNPTQPYESVLLVADGKLLERR